MKKLLIIGASILQLPAIKKAKEMGLYVGVADFNPEAVGIKYADEYFNASTIDENAICDVALKFKPDGIMTLATDMPMRSVAKATAMLRLPGISYDTAVKATDKFEMIKAFKEHGVSSPWYFKVSSLEEILRLKEEISYPCIMKPTDNAGSRGVVLIHDFDELVESYNYSSCESRSGNVIIEEYLEGNEVSVEVMVCDGEVHILQVTDKLTTGAPHFVEMGHSQPSSLPSEIIAAIHALAKAAVQAVGINMGPAHVEMMVTQRGPVMIELGARMGGDCITTHLVPLSTGIDMIKATIDSSLGLPVDIVPKFSKGSAIRFIDACPGIVTSIVRPEKNEIPVEIKEISITKSIGDEVHSITSSIDRTGFVISQSLSAKDAVLSCEKVLSQIYINTKNYNNE